MPLGHTDLNVFRSHGSHRSHGWNGRSKPAGSAATNVTFPKMVERMEEYYSCLGYSLLYQYSSFVLQVVNSTETSYGKLSKCVEHLINVTKIV